MRVFRNGLELGGANIPEGTMVGRAVGGDVAALTSAEVATILSTPSSSTIGNLFTANQASVETDTAGFTSLYQCTVAASSAAAAVGSSSLAVTTTAGTISSVTVAPVGASPGAVYTAEASVKAAGVTRTCSVLIQWLTSAGVFISNSAETTVVATNSGFVRAQVTAVAPANAEKASVVLVVYGANAAEEFYFDKIGLWAGAGGIWAMPGVPITGTGRRVIHPNTDDVLVQAWDATKNRWQVAYYDSGVRSMSASLNNSWAMATGGLYVRRVGAAVYIRGILDGSAATAASVLTSLPVGFRPTLGLQFPVPIAGSLSGGVVAEMNTSGGLTLWSGDGKSGYQYVNIMHLTPDAIPTSLPGTLVSSAPYN